MPKSIPSDRPDFVDAHQPHHAVLAASLAGLPKVEEYSWRSVDTVACRKRRADQPQEPNVLEGSLTDRLLKPSVEPAWSHLQHPAHRSNVEALAVGFDKFVGLRDLPCTRFRTHRHSSAPVTPLVSRVHKKLGSPHVQNGTSLPELGGWKSYEMVLRYAHLAPEKLSFVAGRIERQALTMAEDAPRGKNVAKNATFSLRSMH